MTSGTFFIILYYNDSKKTNQTGEFMKQKRPRLSNLEWEVMNVIWDLGGSPSVRDVLETKYPRGMKAYTTIQTVMNNLEGKGYLRKAKIGLVNFYKPLRKKSEMVAKETNFFIDKVFDGSVMAMANYLLQSDKLSKDQIDNLKKLISEQSK